MAKPKQCPTCGGAGYIGGGEGAGAAPKKSTKPTAPTKSTKRICTTCRGTGVV